MMKRVICCNLLQNKGRRHICASALFRLSDNSQTFATLASKNNDDTNTYPTKSNDNATNSNPREVNKFSSFASNWWDARSNPLVGMNPIRIKFMTQVVNNFQPALPMQNPTDASLHLLPLHNKRVLDIGCGGGLLTESLSRLGASLVVGVDASSKVVEVAKMHTFHENSMLNTTQQHQSDNQSIDLENIANIRYIGGLTVEELASEWLAEREKEDKQQQSSSSPTTKTTTSNNHELFDIITALEVIEHVPNPTSLLYAASTLLKPNGILFVSTINRTIKSYGLAIIAAEYISGRVPIGTHDWNQFRSPDEVKRMVCNAGTNNGDVTLKQIAVSGMVIEPPFVNMNWSLDGADMDVNWIGAYQKQKQIPTQ